jgi:hypothetical protein
MPVMHVYPNFKKKKVIANMSKDINKKKQLTIKAAARNN